MTLREHEIRPDELRQGQSERFAADIRRLIERKNQIVDVTCPTCGKDAAKPKFIKFELSYVECTGCGTLYISPRPTPEILSEYYAASENYAYWNRYMFPASETARREKIFRPRAERLLAICRRHHISQGLHTDARSRSTADTSCEATANPNY